jgi:hypothetical protein
MAYNLTLPVTNEQLLKAPVGTLVHVDTPGTRGQYLSKRRLVKIIGPAVGVDIPVAFRNGPEVEDGPEILGVLCILSGTSFRWRPVNIPNGELEISTVFPATSDDAYKLGYLKEVNVNVTVDWDSPLGDSLNEVLDKHQFFFHRQKMETGRYRFILQKVN